MVLNLICSGSDVKDIPKVHVLGLDNKQAPGKRLNYIADNPYKFQELDMNLKSNGYDKAGVKISIIFYR